MFKIISTGDVSIGCGAAYFYVNDFHHMILVCHYDVTNGDGSVPPLRAGLRHATEYSTLTRYEPFTDPQTQGCPIN